MRKVTRISIHTPTRNATICSKGIPLTPRNFNPHIRAGCDKAAYIAKQYARAISIHTSARDATAIINKSHHKKQYIWYNPHIPLIKDSFIGFSTPIWLTKLILFWCESIRKFSCAIGSHLFL